MQKPKTNLERLGFKDPDLTSPKHDEMMLWLDKNVEEKFCNKLKRKNRERILHIEKLWEQPIRGYNGFILGYKDFELKCWEDIIYKEFCKIDDIPWRWEKGDTPVEGQYEATDTFEIQVIFEVKTTIPSLGELLRQINSYWSITGRALFFVVSPDMKYIDILNEQGIGFISYPDFKLHEPKKMVLEIV